MSLKRSIAAACVMSAALSVPAIANEVVAIEFQERETDDSFLVSNVAPCMGVFVGEVSITFGTAEGELIFDAMVGGEGYSDEEADGFKVYEGGQYVVDIKALEDGGKKLAVTLKEFETGAGLRFGLDVDDAEDGPVEGTNDDANARELSGTAVGALIFNPAGEERAKVGRFGDDGHASVAWDMVCEGAS